MIAESFPPENYSGTARPYGFARYLSEFGYWPIVVCPRPDDRRGLDYGLLETLTDRCEIHRVGSLGRFLGLRRKPTPPPVGEVPSPAIETPSRPAALPRVGPKGRLRRIVGRQLGLAWPAVVKGCQLALGRGFDAIWATGPSWTPFRAAYVLSRITGTPWVADLRDPMTYGTMWQPPDREAAEYVIRLERLALTTAARVVSVTPTMTQALRDKVSGPSGRWCVTITNGYLRRATESRRDLPRSQCLLCYVGRFSHKDRRPDVLFEGLSRACRDTSLAQDVRLQMIGPNEHFQALARTCGIADQVVWTGEVPYAESQAYMVRADVLVLLLTGTLAGRYILSGKIFDYLAARRPILGLVREDGDAARLMRDVEVGVVTGPSDPERVADGIRRCWRLWKDGRLDELAPKGDISRFSRRNLTKELARLFDEVLDEEKRRRAPL